MKKLIVLIGIIASLTAKAQDYLITFTGTGVSNVVSTVNVENLTSGASLIMDGSDILHLTSITTGIKTITEDKFSRIKIYPNPMTDYSIIQIHPPFKGDAVITLIDITGKPLTRIKSNLENSWQDFKLSGLKDGLYMITVVGRNYQFSGKLICSGEASGFITLAKINSIAQIGDEKVVKKVSKGIQTNVEMAYTKGDRLKFTGTSGVYSTVKMDLPTSDKTIAFNFMECKDGDNNNYPIVEIGSQIWMAQNLKTTKYFNGDIIPNISDNTAWGQQITGAYCWMNNNAILYKDKYGAIYNWYCVSDNRNLCPTGWHVPSDIEWGVLLTYLGGESIAGGKLKETGTIHWPSSDFVATNESCFTALPSGDRTCFGDYADDNSIGPLWSSSICTEGYNEGLAICLWLRAYGNDAVFANENKTVGISVRCLKGN